jgi:hypothetical protein
MQTAMIQKISKEIILKKQNKEHATIENLQENLQRQMKADLSSVLNETFA